MSKDIQTIDNKVRNVLEFLKKLGLIASSFLTNGVDQSPALQNLIRNIQQGIGSVRSTMSYDNELEDKQMNAGITAALENEDMRAAYEMGHSFDDDESALDSDIANVVNHEKLTNEEKANRLKTLNIIQEALNPQNPAVTPQLLPGYQELDDELEDLKTSGEYTPATQAKTITDALERNDVLDFQGIAGNKEAYTRELESALVKHSDSQLTTGDGYWTALSGGLNKNPGGHRFEVRDGKFMHLQMVNLGGDRGPGTSTITQLIDNKDTPFGSDPLGVISKRQNLNTAIEPKKPTDI